MHESGLPEWRHRLMCALGEAAYAPGGLDVLSRVTRRYRLMFDESILGSIEAMIEAWEGN